MADEGGKKNPYRDKPDDEMIAELTGDSAYWPQARQMEMSRRLKASVERLDVTTARLNRWMIGLTVVIAILTLVLVILALPDSIEKWRRLVAAVPGGLRCS